MMLGEAMLADKDHNRKTSEVVDMKYAHLDKNSRKQEKSNLKRSIRRRVEKVRNFRSSDIESDNGSDGLAVNSEGSGRSGDWGPPKIRRKSKSYRKRQETRTSYTDSGISLSKTDLESLSGLSNSHLIAEHRSINGYQRILQKAYLQERSKSCDDSKSASKGSSAEHKTYSGLPPVPKLLDKTNCHEKDKKKDIDIKTDGDIVQTKHENDADKNDIEEKENAILEQCLKNEKFNCGDNACSYAVDCGHTSSSRLSRFPLPDHLNYPICRYRMKSDTSRLHPLKKLKDSWKKLTSRKLFQEKQDDLSVPDISYPDLYPNYVIENEDDNAAILSRLSRNPSQRKNLAKRVFNRFGSKSYTINVEKFDDNCRINSRLMSRSGSTRSVPDALQDMWNKVHYKEYYKPCGQSDSKPLPKVTSMPSIHMKNGDNTLFKEPYENSNNYFSQLANCTEKHSTPNLHTEKKSTDGTDIVETLADLRLTQQESTTSNVGAVKLTDDTNKYTNEQIREENEKGTLTKSSKKYSSCHELYRNSNFIIPPIYFPPAPCVCCMSGQQVPCMPGQQVPCMSPQQIACMQGQQIPFPYFYPYNYLYQVPPYGAYPPIDFVQNYYPVNSVQNFYPVNCEQNYHMMESVAQRTMDKVVAPLDVKVAHERKAEKRKIEMVFDTFV